MIDNYEAWDAVKEFHEKNNHARPEKPTQLDPKTAMLRSRLILEELGELSVAFHQKDVILVADGFCDLAYVTFGTAVSAGVKVESFWIEPLPKETVLPCAENLSLNLSCLRRTAKASSSAVLVMDDDPMPLKSQLSNLIINISRSMVALGIPYRECFLEVHRSNMSKQAKPAISVEDGVKYGAGGNPKGPGYTPPNLEPIIFGTAEKSLV